MARIRHLDDSTVLVRRKKSASGARFISPCVDPVAIVFRKALEWVHLKLCALCGLLLGFVFLCVSQEKIQQECAE